jgi:hypothetical protein
MIAGLVGGLFLLLIWVIGGIVALVATIFWIAMLIHALTNRALVGVDKLVWVLVILFLHALGGLIYFFVGRKQGALT